jgi:hypothetical protein
LKCQQCPKFMLARNVFLKIDAGHKNGHVKRLSGEDYEGVFLGSVHSLLF